MVPASLYRSPNHTGPFSVLLAEDQADFRALLARGLEADGAHVRCVEDGLQALDELTRGDWVPDVLLTDVRMPVVTGIDVLRALRRTGRDLPVILITGFGDSVDLAEIEVLGAAVLLEKPFDFDDLRTALRNLGSIARLRCRQDL